MTNAEWAQSRPETTAGEMIAQAEEWYAEGHTDKETAAAGTRHKLTAWLAAEHTDAGERREVTVVTTLTVTHVLHGADADDVLAGGLAQRLANTSLRAARRGFELAGTTDAQPDDLSIGQVQVFGLHKRPETDSDSDKEAQA